MQNVTTVGEMYMYISLYQKATLLFGTFFQLYFPYFFPSCIAVVNLLVYQWQNIPHINQPTQKLAGSGL